MEYKLQLNRAVKKKKNWPVRVEERLNLMSESTH